MGKVIIAKYGELWLKSEPVRRKFIRQLRENLKKKMKESGITDSEITRERDFLSVKTRKVKGACEALRKIFGIEWFAVAEEVESDAGEIEKHVIRASKVIGKGETFAVRVTRTDKSFPGTSMEMEKHLGGKIDGKVDLTEPNHTIFAEIKKGKSYVYTEKIRGLGGLPVGASGKVLCLMSGGLDSPVAAWMMMGRGCFPAFVYFSSYPLVPKTDRENVIRVMKRLREYSPRSLKLAIVSLLRIHEAVSNSCEAKYKCVIGRRIMYRISEKLAEEMNAKALVTGDSLAQVASQTLDNIRSEDNALDMPVLKPLIGMDKHSIIRTAKDIGTYGISVKIKTSCPLHTSRPATRSDPKRLSAEEGRVGELDSLVEKAVREAETIII